MSRYSDSEEYGRDYASEDEHERKWNDKVEELIDLGILGEPIQEDYYRRWPVLKPELLPQGFIAISSKTEKYGEIREY